MPKQPGPGGSRWGDRGILRLGDAIGEAWRNVVSGTTRGVTLAVLFALTVGSIAVIQCFIVIDFVSAAQKYRDAGAAVQIVSLPGAIDGAQCDALASYPAIIASGAYRTGGQITLSQTISRQTSTSEGTEGFIRLLTLDAAELDPVVGTGVWIEESYAAELGASSGESLALANGKQIEVLGTYPFPDDGRDNKLSHQIVSPVPPLGAFDECWVLAWPDMNGAADLMFLAAGQQAAPEGGPQAVPTIKQLNTSLGSTFNPSIDFRALPFLPLKLASVGAGLIIGFVAVRLRRLEMAGALHAGISKWSLSLQITVEMALVLGLGVLPLFAGLFACSYMHATYDMWAALSPAVTTLGIGAGSALLGAQLALYTTREKHLFKYFRER